MKHIFLFITIIVLLVSCQSEQSPKHFKLLSKEQAIIVKFEYGMENLDSIKTLESQIQNVIGDNTIGKYDYYTIDDDLYNAYLHFTCTNADSFFRLIKPTLENTSFMEGAKAKLRYGPPADGVRMEIKNL